MFKIFVRTVRIYIYSAEFFDVMAAVEVLPAPVQGLIANNRRGQCRRHLRPDPFSLHSSEGRRSVCIPCCFGSCSAPGR